MRKWVKYTIAGVIVAALGFATLAGTSAYFFFRHLQTGPANSADIQREFETVRARFGSRQPLVQIVNVQAGDVRINREPHPEGRRATTVHLLTWNADGDRMKSDLPLWLMRFSTLNILSKLGVAPDKFRLTVEDVARYGPGIVIDVRQPGSQVLVWVE